MYRIVITFCIITCIVHFVTRVLTRYKVLWALNVSQHKIIRTRAKVDRVILWENESETFD